MDFDWKSLVRTVAPTIASAFGTPLAGMGVSAILNAILPPDAPKPTDPESYLAQALATATPDLMLKIKEAENKFAVDMKSLGVELQKLQDQDRASARQMQIAAPSNWPGIISAVILTGFFGVLGITIFKGLPSTNAPGGEAILMLMGSLTTGVASVIAFWLGRSKADDTTAQLLANSVPAQSVHMMK